jgi:hypothetical protein
MDRVEYQSLIIQDVINLQKAGELELSPWYQRRSVWNTAQKSYLINTLHEQKPIPAIYIRHSINLESSKSIKEVVDGQQRTRAIISYCSNDFSARHPAHLNKVKFSELKKDEQQKLLLTALPVGYLLGANDSDVIDIFGRINSISKSLNAQEKRNAAYSGEMKQFCLAQASSRIAFWRNYGIFSANEIARMNEVQFISDIVYNLLNGLSDFNAIKIDNFYKKYDDDFPDSIDLAERIDRVFDIIASLSPEKITDTIFSRQPIFFSLFLVIDDDKSINAEKIEQMIIEVDARFNAEENKTDDDNKFYNASTATTQRIAQRKIRYEYIKNFL